MRRGRFVLSFVRRVRCCRLFRLCSLCSLCSLGRKLYLNRPYIYEPEHKRELYLKPLPVLCLCGSTKRSFAFFVVKILIGSMFEPKHNPEFLLFLSSKPLPVQFSSRSTNESPLFVVETFTCPTFELKLKQVFLPLQFTPTLYSPPPRSSRSSRSSRSRLYEHFVDLFLVSVKNHVLFDFCRLGHHSVFRSERVFFKINVRKSFMRTVRSSAGFAFSQFF